MGRLAPGAVVTGDVGVERTTRVRVGQNRSTATFAADHPWGRPSRGFGRYPSAR